MVIAVVIERLDPRRGGAEVYTADFIRWLLRRGDSVVVVCSSCDSGLRTELEALPGEIAIEHVKVARLPRSLRAFAFARSSSRIIEEMKSRGRVDVSLDMGAGAGCDVVQPHSGAYEDNQQGSLQSIDSLPQRTLRAALAALDPGRLLRRALLENRFGRRPFPHVIAVSQRVADSLRKRYGLPADVVHTVHNGVDAERFSDGRLRLLREEARRELGCGEKIVVLTVAHNYRLKGVQSVLAVARRVQDRLPLRFVVVGANESTRARYKREAARTNCRNIDFLEPVPDVECYYAAADAFLLPTFYDACSLTALEALAAGLPVITTDRNGASELLTNGESGYVLSDPRDLDALENVLRSLVDDDVRLRMSRAARTLAGGLSHEKNFQRARDVVQRSIQPSPAVQPASQTAAPIHA